MVQTGREDHMDYQCKKNSNEKKPTKTWLGIVYVDGSEV